MLIQKEPDSELDYSVRTQLAASNDIPPRVVSRTS